jgi:hypothetical protein
MASTARLGHSAEHHDTGELDPMAHVTVTERFRPGSYDCLRPSGPVTASWDAALAKEW